VTIDYNNHAFVSLLKYVTKKVTYANITTQNGRLPTSVTSGVFTNNSDLPTKKKQKNPDNQKLISIGLLT